MNNYNLPPGVTERDIDRAMGAVPDGSRDRADIEADIVSVLTNIYPSAVRYELQDRYSDILAKLPAPFVFDLADALEIETDADDEPDWDRYRDDSPDY